MLKKILKYDIRELLKPMCIFYIIMFVVAVLTRIFFSIKQTVISNILGQIFLGCFYAMLANVLINTVIRSWVKFKEKTYGDESYLTHTLPISKKDIYESRFITTLLTLFTGFIVIVINLLIVYYTKERWLIVKDAINQISGIVNVNAIVAIILILVILFLEVLSGIQSGFLGIILGHRKNDKKILFSIIYGFMTYMLTQLSIILMTFIFGLFNKNIMKLFTSNIIDSSLLKSLIIFSLVIYLIIIIIQKLLGENLLNKGVNVD